MSCPDPCIIYYCFAEFTCDEDILLPLTVDQEGEHIMRIEANGQIYYNRAAQVADADTMTFPNVLNEDSEVIFSIIQPDGVAYSYTVDAIAYTKFKLINKVATDITPAAVVVPDPFGPDC